MKKFLKQIIEEAGDKALDYYKKGFSAKYEEDTGFLTEADEAVSDFLIDSIRSKYPDHKIVSEEVEQAVNPKANKEWVIDPIDGTFNFANKTHLWAVMIAYLENNDTKLSGIYFPVFEDFYFAELDQGAFLNGDKIHISDTDSLDKATGVMHRGPGQRSKYGECIDIYEQAITRLISETMVRYVHYNAIAVEACFFAKGAVDFVINNSAFEWDYLPTQLIMEEAGGIMTDSSGEEWDRDQQDIIAANPKLHKKLLEYFV